MPENTISLRSTTPFASVSIDREAGIIRGASIISAGPADGHGFTIDRVMLQQVHQQIGDGVAMRWTHPGKGEALGTHIGRVVNPRLDGDRIRGDIQFGPHADKLPGLGDVRSYLLDLAASDPTAFGLSIEFAPAPFEKSPDGRALGRSKRVVAADIVGTPAANPAGLLSRTTTMTTDTTTIDNPLDDQPSNTLNLAAEKSRVQNIRNIGKLYGLSEQWQQEHISLGTPATDDLMISARAELAKRKLPPAINCGDIHVGTDRGLDGIADGLADSIAMSHSVRLDKPHAMAARFSGRGVLESGRLWLEALGVPTAGMTRANIARLLMNPKSYNGANAGRVIQLAHTTSDFPAILGNSLNKTLRAGYTQAPRTWDKWARKGTAPDFKQISRPVLGNLPTPPVVLEGAEYTYATMGEANEVYRLVKYGQLLKLTWETLVNDDLNAFFNTAAKFVGACRRLEDDVAYAPITGNQVMADGVQLFNAAHSNLAAVASAISVASLGIGRTALARQTGLAGEVLSIIPAHVLVPYEQLTLAEQVIASLSDPANANANTANPEFVRSLNVVGEARLSLASTTAWYLAASANSFDTVEVTFLEGYETPFLDEEDQITSDTRVYKVRHVVAARALDWRGMYRNPGV